MKADRPSTQKLMLATQNEAKKKSSFHENKHIKRQHIKDNNAHRQMSNLPGAVKFLNNR